MIPGNSDLARTRIAQVLETLRRAGAYLQKGDES